MTIQINGTTGISGVDGSAATPALQGQDTNTGISFGTDTVNVVTGGTTRATVDANGDFSVNTDTIFVDASADRVGVNTTSPTAPLQVNGTGQIARFESSSSSAVVRIANTEPNLCEFTYTSDLAINVGGSERFRIGSAGQLGIGGATYGTSGQVLTSGGTSAAPSWTTLSTSNLTRMTSATASGSTSLDFTSIPTGVRRITIMFENISWNAGAEGTVRIGDSGGIETSGYSSNSGYFGPGSGTFQHTGGFAFASANAASTFSGHLTLTNLRDNLWVSSHLVTRTNDYYTMGGGGRKELSGTLDRLSITSTAAITYDGGSVNVFYEV